MCVSPVPQHRNTATNTQTCWNQPTSPPRDSVQTHLWTSQGPQSISAFSNPTSSGE